MTLRIAGAQLGVTTDIETNTAAIERAIGRAAEAGAQLLLTPEGSLSGYTPHFAEARAAEALARVTAAAARAGVALALGTCFREADGRVYNQIRFIDADGSALGFHSKTLTCGTITDATPRGEIQDYAVAPLRTFQVAGVTVGGLICNDLWANPSCTPQDDPHLTHRLAQMGARVILHAVNGGRGGGATSELCWRYHESNLQMRALASGVWIVTVDSSWPPGDRCSAPSGVVGPDGFWRLRAPDCDEQHFVFDIEL